MLHAMLAIACRKRLDTDVKKAKVYAFAIAEWLQRHTAGVAVAAKSGALSLRTGCRLSLSSSSPAR